MLTLSALLAAGTLTTGPAPAFAAVTPGFAAVTPGFAAVTPGFAAVNPAAPTLKCGPRPPGSAELPVAILVDGTVAWAGPAWSPVNDEARDALDLDPDAVHSVHIICSAHLARLGVEAWEGMYITTRASGVHHLDEALREIHGLQERFRAEHGRWAASVEALGFSPPVPGLALEIEVREDDDSWIARGTHPVSITRCAVSGRVRANGAAPAADGGEDPAQLTCRVMDPDDGAFPQLAKTP